MFDHELFLRAYGKIYRNFGAMTKGSTEETVDGMCLEKIHGIIALLKLDKYQWTPVRRIEIPKINGRMRPLGLPTWSGKLVQEVMRTLLDAYYEPTFSDLSHGFREHRGCHSALLQIRKTWKATFGGFRLKRIPDGMGVVDFWDVLAWNKPASKRSEVVQRLFAGKCELCNMEDVPLNVHHIRKLADLDRPGRRPKADWESRMSAMKRKTLVVCEDCHRIIHAGHYDGPTL